MSSTISKPAVAFFGATGGCTFTALVHTLRAGYPCVALVRTPAKLTSLLKTQGLDESIVSSLLTIHSGNALDVAAVKKTLLLPSNALPGTIITGLGAAPEISFSWRHPFSFFAIDQPTLCGSAAQTLLTALGEIYAEQPALQRQKPLLSFVSSTGITRGPEDVPFFMRFLYHIILATPHMDKKNMEDKFRDNVAEEQEARRCFRSIIGIRPTLLTGGADVEDRIGAEKIRAGTESKPALGYTVKRADVGEWIFKNVIQSEDRKWEGEMVSLTS